MFRRLAGLPIDVSRSVGLPRAREIVYVIHVTVL